MCFDAGGMRGAVFCSSVSVFMGTFSACAATSVPPLDRVRAAPAGRCALARDVLVFYFVSVFMGTFAAARRPASRRWTACGQRPPAGARLRAMFLFFILFLFLWELSPLRGDQRPAAGPRAGSAAGRCALARGVFVLLFYCSICSEVFQQDLLRLAVPQTAVRFTAHRQFREQRIVFF